MSSPITPLTPEQTASEEAQAAKDGYFKRVLIGLDMFANTIANGHPDETISSRSARAATQGKVWGKVTSRFLNLFQKNHGAKAEAGDVQRAQTVKYLEETSGTLPRSTALALAIILTGGMIAGALTGCSNADIGAAQAWGQDHVVKQYSGGQLVGQWESTGKVENDSKTDEY